MCKKPVSSRIIATTGCLLVSAIMSACSLSDLDAMKFRSTLSCGMVLTDVVSAAKKLGGKFQPGNGDWDYSTVLFGEDWIYYLVIREKHGLVYGMVITSIGSGGEFLCCPGVPKCDRDGAT
jgi:hypothetical protein